MSSHEIFVDPYGYRCCIDLWPRVSIRRTLVRRVDMSTSRPPRFLLAVLVLTASACASPKEPTMSATASPSNSAVTAAGSAPVRKGHVAANGVNYYYEVRGQGEPLLLLHGGLGSIEMFGPVLTRLAAARQVIGVDLHGHGRTRLGDRKISIIDQGDDMATIVGQLGYAQVDVMGYSLGAGVAFRFAVQHPDKVRRLVLVSAGFSQDGFYPEMLPQQAQVSGALAGALKDTPMYKSYATIAPDPAEFPVLLDRIGEAMRTPYNWADDVKKLRMPVMLVCGDSDMFRLEHVVEFYHLLGGGLRDPGWGREHMAQNRLAILPDLTHYEIFMAPQLATTVLPFLDGKRGAASWAEQVATEGR
jgi:pimeloyl-ACP methyl ester carboxylesterase